MYSKSKITINNILEAARTLFVENNYADVTITDIAARAEVSKGALYHHFSSKEDLYVRMMHHFMQQIQAVTQSVAENSTGCCRDRLWQSTSSFLKLPDELLAVLRLVRRDINIFKDPTRDELIRAYQTAVPEQVESIIREGIDNGEVKPLDARLLSWGLVALVEIAQRPYSQNVLGGPEEIAGALIDLFFDGVALKQQV